MRLGRGALIGAVVASTIGCDRVTKHVAAATLAGTHTRSYFADTVRLMYAENAGGFLSLGATLPPIARTAIFTVFTALALVALLVVAWRARSGAVTFGVMLFVAGGASNWFDRVTHGSVVDFLNIGIGPLRTGIFNVADMAILGGAAIVLAVRLIGMRSSPQP